MQTCSSLWCSRIFWANDKVFGDTVEATIQKNVKCKSNWAIKKDIFGNIETFYRFLSEADDKDGVEKEFKLNTNGSEFLESIFVRGTEKEA